jgi:hypothetical protein
MIITVLQILWKEVESEQWIAHLYDGIPEPTKMNEIRWRGTCLQSQHSGGWDRRITNLRPAWITQQNPISKKKRMVHSNKNITTIWSRKLTSRYIYISKRSEMSLHYDAHCIIIHSNHDMETTYMTVVGWGVKNMWDTYKMEHCPSLQKRKILIYGWHCVNLEDIMLKWNKPDTERQILHGSHTPQI